MSERLEQPLKEGFDYRQMWAALRNDLSWWIGRDVHAIDPVVMISYMDLIQDIAEFDKKGPANEG